MKPVRAIVCTAGILCFSVVALAATPVVVNQMRRAFSIRDLHVHRGETVRFTNADEFLHQIYIDTKTFKFSSKEQAPGESVDIAFPTGGTFDVKCEIHPKMVLSVTVD